MNAIIIVANNTLTVKQFFHYKKEFSLIGKENRQRAYRYLLSCKLDFPDEFPNLQTISDLCFSNMD